MSERRVISNTLVVTTVEDGQSAPYYFQEWFAWSNVAHTASVTTSPFTEPYNGWQTSIPNQGAYAYLWRKSIRYVFNESTREYDAETAQYFRMSGTNGTSINVKGTILGVAHNDTEADNFATYTTTGNKWFYDTGLSPVLLETYDGSAWHGTSPSDGDAYTSSGDGHLYMYSAEAGRVIDLGLFQGQNGETYYTHIAWATNVTYSGSTVTAVEGFVTTKSPNDTTHLWMGVLVDQNSGQDSSHATSYTWSYTKGVKGDKGDLISYTNTLGSITIACDSRGLSLAAGTAVGVLGLYVNGTSLPPNPTISVVSKPSSLSVTTSGGGIPSGGFSVAWNSGVSMSNLQGTLVMRISSTGYKADVTIPVMCTKQGDRGKTGRFYYFADEWNASDTTQQFSATDAETPFFKVGSNYYVYVGDTNFTDKTMAWMNTNLGGTPSSSNANYKIMVTDFKYLITEAIFGNYAHFGSAIINGDWMISQHGTYGGSTQLTYRQFDPAYPNVSVNTTHTVNGTTWSGYNFVPNYAVDLLAGKTFMTSAEVRGTIRADNMYHGICLLTDYVGHTMANTYWYCTPDSYGDASFHHKNEGEAFINNFQVNNYYTTEEVYSLSGGIISSPQLLGFEECTGYNDVVYVIPKVDINGNESFPDVYLPRPEDVHGKCVDVYGQTHLSGRYTFYVKCVGDPNGYVRMTGAVYYNNNTPPQLVTNGNSPHAAVWTNQACRFMSIQTSDGVWRWLAQDFYHPI